VSDVDFAVLDPSPVTDEGSYVMLEVHNSDRVTYRRCRRKFDFQSRLRQNLVGISAPRGPLWFGSGVHFAFEDFHGYNRFGDPRRAFDAYVESFRQDELPEQIDELVALGDGMLSYYIDFWLPRHPVFPTLVVNGIPQVEVEIQIDITDHLEEWLQEALFEQYGKPAIVVIVQTFDKVEQDYDGRIWGIDYKTAKQFTPLGDLMRLPQANQYFWGGQYWYGDAFEGLIWQQHLKSVPKRPTRLGSGDFSVNKSQHTTYSLYRASLIDAFGVVPKGYTEMLNFLATQDSDEGDRYIRRDALYRNPSQGRSEEAHVIAEVHEMLDPTLPIYPNPTRDCNWECGFKDVSIAMDDGSDYEYMLQTEFIQFQGYNDSWRGRLLWPGQTEPGPPPLPASRR
jgi:hypothetical protein